MNATLEQIAREALLLTPAQRAELANLLVVSLDSSPPDEVQRLWIEEANKRLEEVRSNMALHTDAPKSGAPVTLVVGQEQEHDFHTYH